jgi:hypothetical protein
MFTVPPGHEGLSLNVEHLPTITDCDARRDLFLCQMAPKRDTNFDDVFVCNPTILVEINKIKMVLDICLSCETRELPIRLGGFGSTEVMNKLIGDEILCLLLLCTPSQLGCHDIHNHRDSFDGSFFVQEEKTSSSSKNVIGVSRPILPDGIFDLCCDIRVALDKASDSTTLLWILIARISAPLEGRLCLLFAKNITHLKGSPTIGSREMDSHSMGDVILLNQSCRQVKGVAYQSVIQ